MQIVPRAMRLLFWPFLVSIFIVIGYWLAQFSELYTDRPIFLFAMPLSFMLLFAAVYYRDELVLLIFLSRASLDSVFDASKLSTGGVGLGALLNIFMLLLAMLYLLDSNYKKPSMRALSPCLVFFMLAIMSAIWAPNPLDTVRQSLNLLTYFSALLVGYCIFKHSESRTVLLMVLIASSLIPFAIAGMQLVQGAGRISATFGHPNIFAFYIFALVGLALVAWSDGWLSSKPYTRYPFIIWFLSAGVFLVLTETRSAWLACVVLFCIFALIANRKLLLPIFLIAALALLMPPVQNRVADLFQGHERVEYSELNSFAWRKGLWIASMDYVEQKPLFGYGYTSFGGYANQFYELAIPGGRTDAHNSYVQVLFDLGVVGLITFLAGLLSVFMFIRKSISHAVKPFAAVTGIYLSYIIVGFSDNILFYLSFNWYFWMLIGALVAIYETQGEETRSYVTV